MTIIEELRQNRESGAKRLEAEYKAGLMTLARRFCADESEAAELVNRTFAAVVDGIDNYLEQSAFFGWMCQILSNIHAKDHRNKSNGLVVYPGEVPDMADEAAEDAVFRNIDRSLLREAVNDLPEDQRESVVLHYFLDIPIPKIAKILAVPGGTVKSRLHYARKALAVKLGVAVRKPGAKALLAVIALCAITAAAISGASRLSGPAGLSAASRLSETIDQLTSRQTDELSNRQTVKPSNFSTDQLTNGPTVKPSNRQTFKPSNQQENTMKTTPLLAATAAVTLAAAPTGASAEYQFIISGDPVAAATEGMVYGESRNGPLEVRDHTAADSATTFLTSKRPVGTIMIVR